MSEEVTRQPERLRFRNGRRYKLTFIKSDTVYEYLNGILYDLDTGKGMNPEGVRRESFRELPEDFES